MNRGALIVVEGLDRSGKSTQCRNLIERLTSKGHQIKLLRFPDRTTTIGQLINNYLKDSSDNLDDHVVNLLFSANRWEKCEEMKRDLKQGTTLIIDRYAYSGVAYSSSKDTLSFDWCSQPDRGLPRPDLVLFFEVSEKVAAQRGGFGDEKYETSQFQRRVAENFKKLYDHQYWKTINADLSEDEVYENVEQLVVSCMKSSKDKQVGRLWQDGVFEITTNGDIMTNENGVNNGNKH